VHLLLDVERRRLDNQVGPVLLVLAAPDELRVEIAIAPLIGEADRGFVLLIHDRLELGCGDVAPLILMAQRRDLDPPLGHGLRFPFQTRSASMSRAVPNWPSAGVRPAHR
jgi:hypothetical protein